MAVRKYTVLVYPKDDDWQIVDVEAQTELQAAVKSVNTVMGYDVYSEDDVPFSSVDELNDAVTDLGITRVGDILLKG